MERPRTAHDRRAATIGNRGPSTGPRLTCALHAFYEFERRSAASSALFSSRVALLISATSLSCSAPLIATSAAVAPPPPQPGSPRISALRPTVHRGAWPEPIRSNLHRPGPSRRTKRKRIWITKPEAVLLVPSTSATIFSRP